MLGRRLALALTVAALALIASGCASPRPAPPAPAPPDAGGDKPGLSAAAALGDSGSAGFALERPRAQVPPAGAASNPGATPAPGTTPAPTTPGAAPTPAPDRPRTEADAIALSPHPADDAAEFEKASRALPRSKIAEDDLFIAAEGYFAAERYYHALELYEKLLFDYPQTSHYVETVQRIFEIGKYFCEEKARKPSVFLGIELKSRDYGIEVLERFVRVRERHELSPQALFIIGQTHRDADDAELAIESWQRLVKEYPTSPWARAAEYRIALAFVSISYGVEYDKRPLMTGLRRLKAYVRKYPTGDNVVEAQAKITELEEALAAHDLQTAKNYANASLKPGHGLEAIKALFRAPKLDRYVSARIYLDSIRRDYPKTQAAVEAGKLAGEWPNPAPPSEDGVTIREKEKEAK